MDSSGSTPGQLGPGFSSMDTNSQDYVAEGDDQHPSQLPFASYSQQVPVPYNIVNFYTSGQGPWNPFQPSGSIQQNGFMSATNSINPPLDPGQYRNHHLPSECATSIPGEDSGYGSRAPPSTGLPSRVDAEFPEGEEGLEHFHFASQRHKSVAVPPTVARQTNNFPCRRPGCDAVLKTKSELNKHIQRHDRPHVCETAKCPRKGEGFSTKNDLVRHQRTVHKEKHGDFQPYYCIYGSCLQQKAGKPWPRADNFRQHLQRVHQIEKKADEDLSQYHRRPDHHIDLSAESLTGIGTFEDSLDALPRPSVLLVHETSESPQDNAFENIHQPDVDMGQWSGTQNAINGGLSMSASNASLMPNHQNQGPASFVHGPMGNYATDSSPISPGYPHHFGQQLQMPPYRNSTSFDSASNETMQSAPRLSMPQTVPRVSRVTNDTVEDARSTTDDSDDDDASSRGSISLGDGAPAIKPHIQDIVNALPEILATKRQNSNDAAAVADCLKKLIPRDLLSSTVQLLLETVPLAQRPELVESKSLFRCESCPKRFGRLCELRKHKKRHEKPYGCTWKGCVREFGSKNDWKRHESSQHLRLETWSCQFEGCTKVCTRRESFKNHLIREHNLKPDVNLEQQLDKRRLGRHCDRLYWCGFCKAMQKITESNVNCWTVRCDHIDNHINGRNNLPKMSMAEWKHPEDDSRPGSPAPGTQTSTAPGPIRLNEGPGEKGLKRKNEAPDAGRPRKQVQTYIKNGWQWKCCQCADPIFLTNSNDSCTTCSHQQCTDCSVKALPRESKQQMQMQESAV